MKKNNYLITGGTGFVGSWIVKKLVEKGESVSLLVRNVNLNQRLESVKEKISVYQCDLQNEKEVTKVVDTIQPTIIIHLAALGALPNQNNQLSELIDTNVKGLLHLINAAKKHNITKFINTGSSSEYGIKTQPMKETDVVNPINDYGITKVMSTLYCQKIAITENYPIVTLRLFSPYGMHDDENRLISYVMRQALKNDPIQLSSESHVRDFVYIDDVVRAYMLVINATIQPGEIVNIGSGKQHSVKEVVDIILSISGSKSKILWGKKSKQERQIEPKIWLADINKAKKLLQWQPAYSLHVGLKKTIDQYQTVVL